MTAANRLGKYPLQLMKWLNNLLLWLLAACLAWHTVGQGNQECKETLESNVWGSCRKAWFNIFVKQNKHFWFQSHIWFWGLLLYSVDRLWCLESIHTLLLSRSIPLDLSRSTPFWVDPHPFEKKGVDWLKTSLTVHTVHTLWCRISVESK